MTARPSPLQNRVAPFGEIVASSARGTLFGNRGGCIHDAATGRIKGRPWSNARWICCLLEFKGRKRALMQPGLYTELFFLDEATAFAAGHRPCFECRRPDATRFAEAWATANLGEPQAVRRKIDVLDAHLHAERIDRATRQQVTFRAALSELPDGAIVTLDANPGAPLLLWRGALRPWSFEGYGTPQPLPAAEVTVLTPRSVVAAFAAGYVPAAALP